MTNHPAAIACTLLSYKTVPSRKVFQITVEVAIEKASEAVALLGTPDPDGATWLALARLVPAKEEPAAPAVKAERKRSSLAYLMCQDGEFQKWIGVIGSQRGTDEGYESANRLLKETLLIKEKKELDTDPEAAARFDALRTSFEVRNQVR